jgi:hypothetical protein
MPGTPGCAVDGDAVLLGDFGGAVQRRLGQPAPDVEHPHGHVFVADELQQVAVPADHHDRIATFLRGEGAKDVVGLEPGRPARRYSEGVQHRHDHVDLRTQLVGHLFDVRFTGRTLLLDAVRLVRRNQVDAPLWPPVEVEAHDQAGRPLPADQRGHGVQEST